MTRLPVKQQGTIGFVADMLMLPFMYLLQGTIAEVPQRTHRWNNLHLRNLEIDHLEADKIVIVPGDSRAKRRWLGPIPLFHMPILGGWDTFVVLEPQDYRGEWFVGWVAFDVLGMSKIPLAGPVRLGIGPRQAQFFGVDTEGNQIALTKVGEGCIGKAGQFARIPLL